MGHGLYNSKLNRQSISDSDGRNEIYTVKDMYCHEYSDYNYNIMNTKTEGVCEALNWSFCDVFI